MSELFENQSNPQSPHIESLNDLKEHLQTGSPSEWIEPDGIALNIVPGSAGRTGSVSNAITFASGALTIEQLTAIFSTMPVDLTFIDAEDRVRFFSEGPDRVFIRPKTIIGRKVQSCHPPESLDVVEKIISDFRTGKQDVADFWLNFQGRFVFIRYFALRNESKQYMGTLEVTQDLTRERALSGERRLLEYDTPAKEPDNKSSSPMA